MRARAFILVDESGRSRATLTVSPDGRSQLALLDTNEKVSLRLAVASAVVPPTWRSSTRQARPRAWLGLRLRTSAPSLALFDKEGNSRAELLTSPDGPATLKLSDERGPVTWKAP